MSKKSDPPGDASAAAKTQISIRVDPADLAALEKMGEGMKPVPLNRNLMIGVAIRDYVERNRPKKGK